MNEIYNPLKTAQDQFDRVAESLDLDQGTYETKMIPNNQFDIDTLYFFRVRHIVYEQDWIERNALAVACLQVD